MAKRPIFIEKAGATPTYFPINNGSLETLNIGVFFVM